MGYRIAVAAQHERMVTQHFGRATVFHVFEREDGAWRLAESRVNDPSCRPEGDQSDEHDSLLAYSANLVADCDAVLAARIGPGAVQRLNDRGVEAYAMHALIEDALAALAEELDKAPAQGTDTAITGEPETDR
jgi:predicted Fe-Mo cluster-binding NifX family protein